MVDRTVDVAILGGGLAGNLLARQLRREVPGASVALFERSPERAYKVGESTVEIATHYLISRVDLSTYVYKHHLPKNGLRYFFDGPQKDASVVEMSEIGTHGLPPYPSFQLDRARLEADLIEMNRADGVDLHLPATVSGLTLDAEGHTFEVRRPGDERAETWRARWVVDATGRESMVAKLRDLRVREKGHRIAAAWGRFRGVVDIDDPKAVRPNAPEEAHEWRRRTRFTSRALSTNHFMYPGYWIWLIPLREGITSVGVVRERDQWSPSFHQRDGFLELLHEHRALRELVPSDVEMLDLEAFTQLAFRTKRFFDGAERWACVGDAAAFTDPFYSPGSDFIALENDYVTDLVRQDLGGASDEEVATLGRLYDDFMHFRFDSTLVIYQDLYPVFGSFDIYRAKVFFDTALYYNLLFDSYARDQHLEGRWLRTQLRRRGAVMDALGQYAGLFRGVAAEMHRRGTYHRRNLGIGEHESRKAFGVMEEVGVARTRREVNARSEVIFEHTRDLLAEALDGDAETVARLLGESMRQMQQAEAP